MSHPKDCICVYCESIRKSENRTDIVLARQRIRELEAITQGFARQLRDARADERRKVAEEILSASEHYWDFPSFIENTRNKYLGNKPVSEVNP